MTRAERELLLTLAAVLSNNGASTEMHTKQRIRELLDEVAADSAQDITPRLTISQ